MKVILFGSSGMIGQGVLRECLLDADVSEVVTVVRSATDQKHAKLREVVHRDFTDFSGVELEGDACFWCLGVTSAGMSEEGYTKITHDYAIAAAKQMLRSTMTFIFVSGVGAEGSAMWARVKKKTEDALTAMPFKAVYVIRLGMVQPLHGIKSRTRMYNVLYPILYPLVLVAKLVSPSSITDTERVGRAFLHIAKEGFPKRLLTNADLNAASKG